MNLSKSVFCFSGLISGCLLALPAAGMTMNALDYLNNLREQAGMIPFVENPVLQKSAQNHANYLLRHREWGHREIWGRQGFTGEKAIDRILAAGYPSRHNSENVSSHTGKATAMRSVNGLMSAIYHRFGFLTFDYDEIGIGRAEGKSFHSFVYNMGNAGKRVLCQAESRTGFGRFYYSVCADKRKQVSAEEFDKVLLDVELKNAPIVVWPAENMHNVPPAFFDESPDPLPDYEVSGYPVSIQFNPAFFKTCTPVVTRFELFRDVDNVPVKLIRYMNSENDPHRKFTAFEHAIFPARRLDWDTRYRAEADYRSCDKNKHLEWKFTTAGFNIPLYQVDKPGSVIMVVPGQTIAVYLPPASRHDAKSPYEVSYRGYQKLDVKILDGNTLIITPTGERGTATFTFHGRKFTVTSGS